MERREHQLSRIEDRPTLRGVFGQRAGEPRVYEDLVIRLRGFEPLGLFDELAGNADVDRPALHEFQRPIEFEDRQGPGALRE